MSSELKEKGYKIIKITAPNIGENFPIIAQLFSLYPKEDIYPELVDNELLIHLRQLDIRDFRKNIQKLINSASEEASSLLKRILEEIENIRSYGLKGKKRLYVDYDKERKVIDRKEKEAKRGKLFYVRGHKFSRKNNPLPEEFVNKIIVGDSEEVLKRFPDNCVDLIFTSPPYNFGLEYEVHRDEMEWEKYFEKLFAIFKECIRVLKYGGRIIVNVQPLYSDYIPIHHIISNFFLNNKLIWKGEIIWDKHNYNCKYTAWGSWRSPSNPYLKYTWEFLEIFCKGDLKHPGKPELADISGEEFKRWVYGKWDIPPEMNMKKYGHPAMFPEALVERVLKLFSYRGDVVLDPFNGVGTTTAVAKRLGRIYVGIDISEEYCRKAEERVRNTPVYTPLFQPNE
jgi:DNA modification methylase